jgi:hypothetical protein
MGAVALETLGQEFFLVHRSHPSVPIRHGHDERDLVDVTCQGGK